MRVRRNKIFIILTQKMFSNNPVQIFCTISMLYYFEIEE